MKFIRAFLASEALFISALAVQHMHVPWRLMLILGCNPACQTVLRLLLQVCVVD